VCGYGYLHICADEQFHIQGSRIFVLVSKVIDKKYPRKERKNKKKEEATIGPASMDAN
jgi:hypothetical protein